MKIGIGYDIHALKKGRPFVLGGVRIPHSKGPVGHSDGDALLHAVVDAVLGALGAGDIGEHFSDRDASWRDASSAVFAAKAVALMKKKGYRVENLDTIALVEEPKLGPHKQAIRKSLSELFDVPETAVGVKAKTNEGFGAIGAKKAVACWAVVALKKV